MSESIAQRYSRLARERSVERRVDVALRTLDILFSGLFLLLSLPLTLLIATLVLATSGRPLFYRGERVGLGDAEVPDAAARRRGAARTVPRA